jgi:hypothetical protein
MKALHDMILSSDLGKVLFGRRFGECARSVKCDNGCRDHAGTVYL